MASQSTIQSSKEALENELAMRLLSTIEGDQSLSQRSLALRLGIAVGLANTYLKRCVRKGWIKVQQVPARRCAYYLTPTGFSEKTRLVGDYLTSSLGFFRRARAQYAECLTTCARRKWWRTSSGFFPVFGCCSVPSITCVIPRRNGRLQGIPV